MMKTQIPGSGELEIKNLILDFNGTIAKDGKVLEGVKELLGEDPRGRHRNLCCHR